MDRDLLNYGVLQRGQPNRAPRTAIVVGIPRGGTSMVAGALAHLGVPMGRNVTEHTFEDRDLSGAIESDDLASARSIIESMNTSFDLWGWKRPSSFRYLELIDTEFRNPHYLVVFRDAVAVAGRRQVSMGFDIIKSMRNALAAYRHVLEFVAERERPFLLLSYDKCLQYPDRTVTALTDFLGIAAGDSRAASAFIEPSPRGYLETSHRDAEG